jgi:hypothetical protein
LSFTTTAWSSQIQGSERKASLEIGNALDLAGHQHRAIDQVARLALLGDHDPLPVEILTARWRQMELGAGREDDLAVSPGLIMPSSPPWWSLCP